jgi:hypothetical protein
VLDIASTWLSTCSETHQLCKSDEEGLLPTRLLSLTGPSPRLVLASELSQRPQYATLSHSWGSHDVIQLTTDNLESFMGELPVESLPKTFKEAIEIAQHLGLGYMWIDSLCIIQDDEEDWEHEAGMMHSVYGGSAITIAASSARDSTQGCYMKSPIFSGGLRARITDGGRRRVQDFRGEEVYHLSTFGSHLGTRAWALQEKMLPARTIHFSDRGAFWECRTTIASEFMPDGFPSQLVSPLVRREGKFEWVWPQVVRLYSAANLTYGRDKLPAISGVARLGHSETGDQYLAGLWRGQLLEQLCWRRAESKYSLERPPWRAPTWSWASIDGQVSWQSLQEGILETKYAHVVDASTTLHGHDPFGQVTRGEVRLACSFISAGYLAHPDEFQKAKGGCTVTLVGDEKQTYTVQVDCLDDIDQDQHIPVYLVPILGGRTGTATRKNGGDRIDELATQGIVLRATKGANGEFVRIASFRFHKNKSKFGYVNDKEGEDVETQEPFLRYLDQHGRVTAEEVCAEIIMDSTHPDQRCVIAVI